MDLQYILCAHAENCRGINGILQAAPFWRDALLCHYFV